MYKFKEMCKSRTIQKEKEIDYKEFLNLLKSKKVLFNLNLNEIDMSMAYKNVLFNSYNGESRKVWCLAKPINSLTSLNYKIRCVPLMYGFKYKDFYTMDLFTLIKRGLINYSVKN